MSLRRRGTCSLAWTEDSQVLGIAAARPRSGPRTWEASHLYLASENDSMCQDLIRMVTQRVARLGGERIFVRFAHEDPLIDDVRVCGFSPSGREYLYRGRRRSAHPAGRIDVRDKSRADEYSIFLLYTACTPSDRRLSSGMTFGQWSASREKSRGRTREFVYLRDGEVRGWIRTVRGFRAGMVLLMVHPDDEASIDVLLDYGLERLPGQGEVFCLVSEHQSALIGNMWQRGFEVQSEYLTLVRSMVTPVLDEERKAGVTRAPVG